MWPQWFGPRSHTHPWGAACNPQPNSTTNSCAQRPHRWLGGENGNSAWTEADAEEILSNASRRRRRVEKLRNTQVRKRWTAVLLDVFGHLGTTPLLRVRAWTRRAGARHRRIWKERRLPVSVSKQRRARGPRAPVFVVKNSPTAVLHQIRAILSWLINIHITLSSWRTPHKIQNQPNWSMEPNLGSENLLYPLDAGVEDSKALFQSLACSARQERSRKRTWAIAQLLSNPSRSRYRNDWCFQRAHCPSTSSGGTK